MAYHVDLLQGQLPLREVVLCCTSVPQDVRTHLAQIATEMGAVHKLDLTSDVTHLIVGSIVTPKYQYVARERADIKVLLPAWLEETRTLWMEGADVDINALERKHRCPPFFGLHICLTGFDDLEQRTFISSTVTEQGATYHGDLTKAVTHLITAVPSGQKYIHAKKWGITSVSLRWFHDTLRRGMALDESLYDPNLPAEDQGRGAFKRERKSLGKHDREGDIQKTGHSELARKRLRRTASTRLESQSQDMWQHMAAEPSVRDKTNADAWRDDRSHSSDDTPVPTCRPDSDMKSTTTRAVSKEIAGIDDAVDALFTGYSILIHGFQERRTSFLKRVLLQNGAMVKCTPNELEDMSDQPSFKTSCLLVPHAASGKVMDLPDVPATTLLVTEWWVERCIHYKRALDPATDALSVPLWDAEVTGFGNLLISTTGFSGVDFRQVAEAVKLMGATYQEKILPTSSVLVSGSTHIKKEKAFYASKHHIPVVSADWLLACLKRKRTMPFEGYKVTLPAFDRADFHMNPSASGLDLKDPPQGKANETSRRDSGKDEVKRLSSSRKRQVPPCLALHSPEVNIPVLPPPARVMVHEDGESSLEAEAGVAHPPIMFVPKHSQSAPLREVSSNLSPARDNNEVAQGVREAEHLESESIERSSHSVSPSKAASGRNPPAQEMHSTNTVARSPAPRTHHELTADLADLLSKTISSRPSSVGPTEPTRGRKRRPLGRASSGASHRSTSASASAQSQGPHAGAAAGETERENKGRDALPPPSTQLGYETPETQAHRVQMSKKMGTKLHDDCEERRVPRLGIVKDTSLLADAAVGNRIKGRGRAR